jgi:hypothetical protein
MRWEIVNGKKTLVLTYDEYFKAGQLMTPEEARKLLEVEKNAK